MIRRASSAISSLLLLVVAAVPACVAAPSGQEPPAPEVQAKVLVSAGAAVRTVESIAAMQALAGLKDGAYVVARGYRRPGDHGGGVFGFDAASEAQADGGVVFAPKQGAGRFRRVFDPEGDVYAEWFGAYGDGGGKEPHDDQAAINACLGALGRVRLLGKTYGVRGKPAHYNPAITYHSVDLITGCRIEGVGRDATRVKLLSGTNPKGSAPSSNYFSVLANRDFYESADYVIVRDLTVDCNFDGQNRHSTIHAIGVRGGAPLVERVNFRGYGTGWHPENGSSRECFVVHQSLVYKDANASRQGAVLRDLDFTDPGHNGDLPGHVAEITHMSVGGANNFQDFSWIVPKGKDPEFDPTNGGENERNWWPTYGGLIENCVIHDVVFDPKTQKSPLNGFTYGDSIGMTVRGNRVERFDGSAVFVMSWWNKGANIADNTFLDVACGFALHIKGEKGKPIQVPLHQDVVVERNTVRTGKPMHTPWGTRAVHLYGQDLGTGIRMRNMTFRNNTFEGRAYTNAKGDRVCPAGITVQILHANYRNLRFLDNVIDVPDYAQAPHIPQEPYSMSLTFFPLARWDGDVKSGNVVYQGNRTREGRLLYPMLTDWSLKNPPQWGKPEGAVPAK